MILTDGWSLKKKHVRDAKIYITYTIWLFNIAMENPPIFYR